MFFTLACYRIMLTTNVENFYTNSKREFRTENFVTLNRTVITYVITLCNKDKCHDAIGCELFVSSINVTQDRLLAWTYSRTMEIITTMNSTSRTLTKHRNGDQHSDSPIRYRLCVRHLRSVAPRTNSHVSRRPMAAAVCRPPWRDALALPANRAIPGLYICIWRWRSVASLLSFLGFPRENGECWHDRYANSAHKYSPVGVGRARRPARPRNPCNSASSARVCIAQTRSRWPVRGRVCCGGDGGPLGTDRYARRRVPPAMAATVLVARHAS